MDPLTKILFSPFRLLRRILRWVLKSTHRCFSVLIVAMLSAGGGGLLTAKYAVGYGSHTGPPTWETIRCTLVKDKVPGVKDPDFLQWPPDGVHGGRQFCFPDGKETTARWNCRLPPGYCEGSDIVPNVYAGFTNANPGDVKLGIEVSLCKNGEPCNVTGPIPKLIPSDRPLYGLIKRRDFETLPGTGLGINDSAQVITTRLGTDGQDGFLGHFCVEEVSISAQVDSIGSMSRDEKK